MSIDPSLKVKNALQRHRNVLTRTERIENLIENDAWQEGDSVLGIVKVANRKVAAQKKEKKAPTDEEGEAIGDAVAGSADSE